MTLWSRTNLPVSVAGASSASNLETDAAIAAGDDDNRIVVRARHRRLRFV